MAYAHSERLSAIDLSFLAMEDGRAHMHIGSVSIYDAKPLRGKDGGLDFERILEFIEGQLHKVPRCRQRLEWVPGFRQPVWVDDTRFNLRFHVRHTALPPPGDVRQLKRLAGRIMSQEFDRGKPLWENWFVDGLEGDRFALISKIHHCVADGISGVEMANMLVGPNADYEPKARKAWIPRPAPTGTQLVIEELRHRAGTPLSLLRSIRRGAADDATSRSDSPSGLGALASGLREVMSGHSATPLDVEVGPHRRFDWTRFPFDEVREIGRSVDAKLNDVVLAIAAGALRRFLQRRGVDVDAIDFRAMIPVSVRSEKERASLGNRVSSLLARLPLDEPDPWKRLLRVVETTHELKASGQSSAGDLLGQVVDVLPTQLLGPLFRLAGRSSGVDLVITNVPGPRVPVYLLGARMLETYPVVPLAANQALGIALLSYDDGLYWGFNADWDALPDLHDLVDDVENSFEALRAVAPSRTAPRELSRPGPVGLAGSEPAAPSSMERDAPSSTDPSESSSPAGA
jgi:WS/DGAT/MGAT family acyltransferase